MSNIFQDLLNDPQGVEERLLGPSYPYYKNIKSPSEIGMSDKGSIQALTNDINGLIQYVEVLVTGTGGASTTGAPLGNKFFLQTGAKCLDQESNEEKDRYIYVNNVPTGQIPIISQGLGVNFTETRGLIPGLMGNLNVLNPFGIMTAFLSGSKPPCQELTMQTIDVNNNKSSETHFVTLSDIQRMDPCIFPDKTNPNTKETCKESFTTQDYKLPKDHLTQLYLASISVVGLYIFYKIMRSNKK
jgi:hypothetical protein